MTPPPPRSTLFPYTTLFRSHPAHDGEVERPDRRAGEGTNRCNDRSAHCDGQDRSEWAEDRKSTCLNSSHVEISYAVFCLKKKKKKKKKKKNKTKYNDRAHK